MLTTRRTLLDDFMAFVSERNDPAARKIADAALTRALEKVYQHRTWSAMVSTRPFTFATVANQSAYALPPYFGRVCGRDGVIRNLTTGQRIDPIGFEELQAEAPTQGTALEAAGTPARYALGGVVGVALQPPAGDEALQVVSSSAADTAVRVQVSGYDLNGVYLRREVVLTGAASVALGSWSAIESFSKAYPAGVDPTTPGTSSEGTVELQTAVGAVALQTLLPSEDARQLQTLVLSPTPASVWTISVPIYRKPLALIYDAEALPEHWENAVWEELHIQWLVNTGEMTVDTASASIRPALIDLIAWENLSQPPTRTRPFGMSQR